MLYGTGRLFEVFWGSIRISLFGLTDLMRGTSSDEQADICEQVGDAVLLPDTPLAASCSVLQTIC